MQSYEVSQTGKLSITFNKNVEIDTEKYSQLQWPEKVRLLEEEEDEPLVFDMQ